MAKVSIKRRFEWSGLMFKMSIYIDGEKMGTIANGEQKTYQLDAGEHYVFAKQMGRYSSVVKVNIKENEEVNLKLSDFKYSNHILFILIGIIFVHYLQNEISFVHFRYSEFLLLIPFLAIVIGVKKNLRLIKQER